MNRRRAWAFIRYFITSGALFLSWMMFSASMRPASLIAGAVGASVIGSITFDEFLAPHEVSLNSFLPKPLRFGWYLFYLMYAIFRSSIALFPVVFSGKVNPKIVHFRTRMKSDLGRSVLANSITLTPGTITIDLNDDHLIVHWMFATTAHSRRAGEEVKGDLEARLRRVWL